MIKRAEDKRPQTPNLEEKTSLSRTDRVSPVLPVPHVRQRTPTPVPPPPTTPPGNQRQIVGSRRTFLRKVTRRQAALLIAMALLVVISGPATFYFRSFNYIQRVSLLNEAAPNPYSSGGTLALNDPLKDNSNGYFWYEGTNANNGGTCTFTGGAYHISVAQLGSYWCGPDPIFSKFVYQVQMKIIKGDYGGIDFRTGDTSSIFYYFVISQDGTYELVLNTGRLRHVLTNGSDSSIHRGFDQENTIAVITNGNTITLYANGHQLASVNDSTYSQGQIGVIAEDMGNPTEVEFRDAKVWTL